MLFLASPGAAGTLLPVLHPCPVDAPWLAELHHASGEHAGHHAHQSQAPAAGHHGASCTCIGSCLAAGAAAPPAQPGITSAIVPTWTAGWPSHDSSLVLAPTASLLPPSTAPPVV